MRYKGSSESFSGNDAFDTHPFISFGWVRPFLNKSQKTVKVQVWEDLPAKFLL